jgi:GNAT superfamily N-acetyltransferase
MDLNPLKKRPADCAKDELRAFCDLVKKGDEVDPDGLEDRVWRASLLVFGFLDGTLACVGGMKDPDKGYRARVFRKAGSKLIPEDFPVELGWVMVEQRFRRRGFGMRVLNALIGSFEQNVYTTSRIKNEPMHGLLVSCGFSREGRPWRSGRGPYDLILHVKPM